MNQVTENHVSERSDTMRRKQIGNVAERHKKKVVSHSKLNVHSKDASKPRKISQAQNEQYWTKQIEETNKFTKHQKIVLRVKRRMKNTRQIALNAKQKSNSKISAWIFLKNSGVQCGEKSRL